MVKKCRSELGLSGFLSALSFVASFEELANCLIDKIDANVENTPRTAIELSLFSAKRPPVSRPTQAQVPGMAGDYFDILEARLKGGLS